jgi:hypothetical protein
MTNSPTNTFIDGPLGTIYLKTALPIILVMGMNGLLPVANAQLKWGVFHTQKGAAS